MATQRQRFEDALAGSEGPAITGAQLPEFPKLPACLKKRLTEQEKKEVDEYEFNVIEFFKKLSVRGGL
jgi:hypothetical protein